jgi:hypothetical protein
VSDVNVTGQASNVVRTVTTSRRPVQDMARVSQVVIKAGQQASEAQVSMGVKGALIGAPFVAWDVYQAAAERDATRKIGKTTHAALSVTGTALGVGAAIVGSGPAAAVLVAGSVAVGGFQMVDQWANKGRATQAIGTALVNQWKQAHPDQVAP